MNHKPFKVTKQGARPFITNSRFQNPVVINILQILRNNARTSARLDINSDFPVKKYRSCKYPRRNSVRGMYVSASSCKLRIGQHEIRAWYPVEFLLFMNKYVRSEAKFDAANISHPSINCLHLHLFRHAFYKLNHSCLSLLHILTNNTNSMNEGWRSLKFSLRIMARSLAKVGRNWLRRDFYKIKNSKMKNCNGKVCYSFGF